MYHGLYAIPLRREWRDEVKTRLSRREGEGRHRYPSGGLLAAGLRIGASSSLQLSHVHRSDGSSLQVHKFAPARKSSTRWPF